MQELKKKGCQDIGRSSGGLSTKIHATCDALGNPTGIFLTPGQTHDLVGFDNLSNNLEADYFFGDKAYDAESRVIEKIKEKKMNLLFLQKKIEKFNVSMINIYIKSDT